MSTLHRATRIFIALSLFISIGISPAISAGRTNQSIANTVLSGKGTPSAKLGINGDFYIDVLTFNIYGPKINNRWPSPVSLKGPAGVNGSDGKQGEKGSSSNQSFVYDSSTFNAYPSASNWWKIKPVSEKILVKEDLKVFCTECGSKRKKDSHKFCPHCGTKY